MKSSCAVLFAVKLLHEFTMHPRAKKRTSQGPLNVASGTTRRHSPRRQDTLFFRHSLEKRSTESAYADPFLFFELLGGARALAVGGRNSCSDTPMGDPLARIGPTNGRKSAALSDAIRGCLHFFDTPIQRRPKAVPAQGLHLEELLDASTSSSFSKRKSGARVLSGSALP